MVSNLAHLSSLDGGAVDLVCGVVEWGWTMNTPKVQVPYPSGGTELVSIAEAERRMMNMRDTIKRYQKAVADVSGMLSALKLAGAALDLWLNGPGDVDGNVTDRALTAVNAAIRKAGGGE